jgi:hypothetical protein
MPNFTHPKKELRFAMAVTDKRSGRGRLKIALKICAS